MSAGGSNTTNPPVLPNPYTDLAWLPPGLANQVQMARYIAAFTVGAWIWDILSNFSDEVLMFRKRRLRFPDIVYIFARIASGCFILTCFVFDAIGTHNCQALVVAIGWAAVCSVASNSLLFLIRINAIFSEDMRVKILFTLVWLAAVGCTMTSPFSLEVTHIGTTNFCGFSRVRKFASAGMVAWAVNDTLVCAAITVRIVLDASMLSGSRRLSTILSGEGVGYIARILLQGGLQYYFTTVGFSISSAAVILAPSVPAPYSNVLSVPNHFLANSMASRVYRQLRLGALKEISGTAVVSRDIQFGSASVSPNTTAGPREGKDSTFKDSMFKDSMFSGALTSHAESSTLNYLQSLPDVSQATTEPPRDMV